MACTFLKLVNNTKGVCREQTTFKNQVRLCYNCVMEQNLKPEIDFKNQLMKVTPFSKYMALILFISLPFIGGYVGYVYAPEKIVETEKIIYREMPSHNLSVSIPPSDTESLPGGKVIVNGYRYEFSYKPDPSYPGATLNEHLFFVSPTGKRVQVPDNVWFKIHAASAFAETGISRGQNLESFDMPIHPLNQDIIFLSTTESLDDTYSRGINRIYSYNLQTLELLELYSETVEKNAPQDAQAARIIRTVGIDGSKIIVLFDSPGNSPGPCTNIWFAYKDQMNYLELADVQGGLKPYNVPSSKMEEAQADVEKCKHEFELNGGI